MIKKISQLIYLIIFISFQTCLASLPANLISDDEKVVRGSLKNGMDYIIYPHSSPKGQVNFWLQIHSGSLQEEEDQRGIAHFVEHMMFNGTRDYPNNSVIEEFEKLGLKFGRDVNAYTNYSETVYQFNMPSDNQQNISKVMNIFYNWASQATFDPKEVDDERGVIVEEWRANQGLKWRNSMQRYPFTLTDSRHLIREPIGLMNTINHVLDYDISFGIGPAGTGKTYLAVAAAVDALEKQQIRRIVLTRPAVEAGEKLGFLPGDLSQKVDPYLRPLYDALFEMLGFEKVEKLIEKSVIEVAPLAYMRGRTLNDALLFLMKAKIPQLSK